MTACSRVLLVGDGPDAYEVRCLLSIAHEGLHEGRLEDGFVKRWGDTLPPPPPSGAPTGPQGTK